MGFEVSVSLHPAIVVTGALALTPAGLPPAERASLHWTHKQMGLFQQPASDTPEVLR
jgi:hypothetical protein